MKKTTFLSSLLFWPVLCLATEDCTPNSRTLLDLSKERFAGIARDYIRKKKIVYIPQTQTIIKEQGIRESDIERTLQNPSGIKARSDGPNEYGVIGSSDEDGNQLHIAVSLESRGQLVVIWISRHVRQRGRIPLFKDDFVPFISRYLDQKELIYSEGTRQKMREQTVGEEDIERVLRYPIEVGNQNMQHYTPDSVIYVRGTIPDGNSLRVGIVSEPGKRIRIIYVNRILDNQIPLLKKDFMHFISEYFGEGKEIVYTRHARDRMRGRGISEYDIEYALKNPVDVGSRAGPKGRILC